MDTSASHNFVKREVTDVICLKRKNYGINVKAINSSARATAGVASEVTIQLGRRTRKGDFTVMCLDDFETILGQDFLRRH